MPNRIEAVDYPDGYEVRTVDAKARISFKAKRIKVGRPFAGRRVGVIPTTQDDTYTIVYRHQPIRTINLTQ